MAKQISFKDSASGVKHSPKERMRWHAKQSKVGAKDKKGNELSDFNRGREFEKAESLGKTLGSFAIKKAAEKGDNKKVEQLKATRAEYKVKKASERATYKAKKTK